MIKRLKSYNKYLLGIICIIFLFQALSYYNFDKDDLYGDSLNFKAKDLSTSIFLEWNELIGNSGESKGKSIVIDSQNNIYIAGEIFNSSKNAYDVLVIKYNSSGDIQWNRTWGGNSDDKANAVVVDSLNNVYITGETNSYGNGSSDVFLIKWDNLGNLDWNETWGGEQNDIGYSIALYEIDKIYVVGYSELNDIYGDIVILKYNSSGSLKLNKTMGGPDTDCGNAIEIDSNENIYITGYTSSFGVVTSDLLVLKCDNNGDHIWNMTWGGNQPDTGNDLIIDSSTNITVVGNTQNYGAGNTDVVLLNVNNSGILQWNFTYGTGNHDIGNSLDLDSNGNIFITGHSNNDILLIKINQTGVQKWMKTWGDNGIAVGNSIAVDNFDNIFLTGKVENEFNDPNLFLWKLLPYPDNFNLTSDAHQPDPDGSFTLKWTESLDAGNYSLYKSNYPIAEYNSSVIEIISGNTNQTYLLENLEEDTYYFQVVAFNKYGNTSSNCIRVQVQYPPGIFSLNDHINPDTDGNYTLTWTTSEGADNYSIYVHDNIITDITIEGTLLVNNLTSNYFLIENLTNGDYYYIINAYNEAGETLSNCINVTVRRAPDSFSLTSDAERPDDDGTFELIWSNSEFAINYSLYISNYSISEINESVQIIYNFTPSFEWSFYRYKILNVTSGSYFFLVKAFNQYGSSATECIEVIVSIPNDYPTKNESNNDPEMIIQQIIFYLILVGIITGLIVLYNIFKK